MATRRPRVKPSAILKPRRQQTSSDQNANDSIKSELDTSEHVKTNRFSDSETIIQQPTIFSATKETNANEVLALDCSVQKPSVSDDKHKLNSSTEKERSSVENDENNKTANFPSKSSKPIGSLTKPFRRTSNVCYLQFNLRFVYY